MVGRKAGQTVACMAERKVGGWAGGAAEKTGPWTGTWKVELLVDGKAVH